MAGRRTPSGRPGSALLRGKRRPAAARRDGRAASLPACLSPRSPPSPLASLTDCGRSPEPAARSPAVARPPRPGGVSHAPHGSTDKGSPPFSASSLRRRSPPPPPACAALRCLALGSASPRPQPLGAALARSTTLRPAPGLLRARDALLPAASRRHTQRWTKEENTQRNHAAQRSVCFQIFNGTALFIKHFHTRRGNQLFCLHNIYFRGNT